MRWNSFQVAPCKSRYVILAESWRRIGLHLRATRMWRAGGAIHATAWMGWPPRVRRDGRHTHRGSSDTPSPLAHDAWRVLAHVGRELWPAKDLAPTPVVGCCHGRFSLLRRNPRHGWRAVVQTFASISASSLTARAGQVAAQARGGGSAICGGNVAVIYRIGVAARRPESR